MESSTCTREIVARFSCDELCDYLYDQAMNEDVIFTARENFLVGQDFMDLTDQLLKEIFPFVGSTLPVSRLLKTLQPTNSSL